MYSIFNAISTHDIEDDAPPRNIPWRLILILTLLLTGAAYGWLAIAPIFKESDPEQDVLYRATAGMVAEEIEYAYAQDVTADAEYMGNLGASIFGADQPTAYVRFWDPRFRLITEITAGNPPAVHAGPKSALPEYNFKKAATSLMKRVETSNAKECIVALLGVMVTQAAITDQLSAADSENPTPATDINIWYISQDETLRSAELLEDKTGSLADARAAMRKVLDALTGNAPDAVEQALSSSEDAQSALTMELEYLRADLQTTPMPAQIAAHAPRQMGCSPSNSRRVLIPLFRQSIEAGDYLPAGYAEFGFYKYPTDAIPRAGWRLAPLGAALLGIICALVIRRRKSWPPVRHVLSGRGTAR